MKRVLTAVISFLIAGLILSAQTEQVIKTVEADDGSQIEYLTAGEGNPVIVFVHCWNCDKDFWTDQINYFKQKHKVVSIDLAGYGNSTSGRDNYTIEAFGKDVATVVENEDLNDVVLVGHSMGSSVVLEAAAGLGGRVIGVVGIDSYQDFNHVSSEEQKEQYLSRMRDNYETFCPQFIAMMFPENADSNVVKRVQNDICSADQKIAYSAMMNLFNYDEKPVLAKLTVPVRAINATYFPTNVEGNRELADFDVKLMDGVGHFLHLEQPVKFNELLTETVNELSMK